jgi:hypothetical protein
VLLLCSPAASNFLLWTLTLLRFVWSALASDSSHKQVVSLYFKKKIKELLIERQAIPKKKTKKQNTTTEGLRVTHTI